MVMIEHLSDLIMVLREIINIKISLRWVFYSILIFS